MDLKQFIKAKADTESPVGDLCADIMGDNDFPIDRDDDGLLSYIKFKARMHDNSKVYKEFLQDLKTS